MPCAFSTSPTLWGECEHPILQSRLGITRHSMSPKDKWQIPDSQLRGEARQGWWWSGRPMEALRPFPRPGIAGQPSKCRLTVSATVYDERAARGERPPPSTAIDPERSGGHFPCSL